MYTDTMVIASIAVIGGIFLFAGCFALFIWLDAANDEDSAKNINSLSRNKKAAPSAGAAPDLCAARA